MKIDNADGGYSFTASTLGFASDGVIVLPGMVIGHAVFDEPLPLPGGFEAVRRHLERIGRPLSALCGFDLGMPRPLGIAEFGRFNEHYLSRLAGWGLLRDGGSSPLARTNIAPVGRELAEPVVRAFSYTTPGAAPGPGFVLSGVPELPERFSYPQDIVRRGQTSHDALAEKTRSVLDVIAARITALGADWTDCADLHLYTAHDIASTVRQEVRSRVGVVPARGITWHYAAPPIKELELEIDVRRYSTVLTL
ncbi:MAG TPA: hypothetical protein VF070_24305 [Streptosporangiaceae bacterium]